MSTVRRGDIVRALSEWTSREAVDALEHRGDRAVLKEENAELTRLSPSDRIPDLCITSWA